MAGLDLTDKQLDGVEKKIRDFIHSSVESSGASGVVFGLSGGIDSAVVAGLAKETGVNAKALILPYGDKNPDDVEHARGYAEKLGIEYKIIDIKPVVDAVVGQAGGECSQTSLGNIMARCRMILLYANANEENRLVLGTGNKTELLLGYFTKYGDGGVDLLPIAGLYKNQLRQLAEKIKVPDEIVGKTPTAGLWDGQTDEGEIGIEYAKIDKILHLLYDAVAEPETAANEAEVELEMIEALSDRVKKNTHKTKIPPIADLSEILG